MDSAAIKKYKDASQWYRALKAADCMITQVSPEIQEMSKKKDLPILLDVAWIYGQLSNLRVTKKKTPGTKKEFNIDEANDCFEHAISLYQQILSIDKKNIMALQSMAYVFYKYIIAYLGVNKKEVKQMPNIKVLECFQKMNEAYDTLFSIPFLPPGSEIKARYRRSKAWEKIVLSHKFKIGETIIDTFGLSYSEIRRQVIDDLTRALELYRNFDKKRDLDASYNLYIKSLYTLGHVLYNSVYDNSYKTIQTEDGINTTIFNEFLKNPEQVDLTQYRPARNLEYLVQSENCFQEILNSYKIERYTKIDMKQLALAKGLKHPLSPHYIFYRLGMLYSKWFLITAIPEKTRRTQLSKAYMGVYFFFLANEYSLWRKKMNLHVEGCRYIMDHMNKLLRATDIDFYRDDHIKNMLSNFDTVLTKIKLPR